MGSFDALFNSQPLPLLNTLLNLLSLLLVQVKADYSQLLCKIKLEKSASVEGLNCMTSDMLGEERLPWG